MRVCRFEQNGEVKAGFYFDDYVVPVQAASEARGDAEVLDSSCLLRLLPHGENHQAARDLLNWVNSDGAAACESLQISCSEIQLKIPNPRPNKLFLLAGNYAKHIEEGGGTAREREETFPYVFMKPASTTLTDPGSAIKIPKVNPNTTDWELELGIVIGKGGKHISEADALSHVAGYTIFNDISDRGYHPNENRKERPKDGFFDWLHGKWHDSFCPCGPCIASPDTVTDPQALALELKHNGEVRQDSNTAEMVFPVAAVIEFISQSVTLEPGDMISTGTAAGVGNTTKTYLKAGDLMHASIDSIGTLITPVEDEA